MTLTKTLRTKGTQTIITEYDCINDRAVGEALVKPTSPIFPAYDIYYNDNNYVGYKLTFTFNHQEWSLAESWNSGISKITEELDTLYTDVKASFMVLTAEPHVNLYAHMHGVIFLRRGNLLQQREFLEYFGKRFVKRFGRTQIMKLDTRQELEKLNVPGLLSTKCWLTYILKEGSKYQQYLYRRQD